MFKDKKLVIWIYFFSLPRICPCVINGEKTRKKKKGGAGSGEGWGRRAEEERRKKEEKGEGEREGGKNNQMLEKSIVY